MKPARILGHHVHPIFVVFPLGLLAMSLIFDGVYFVTGNPVFEDVAYWDILAGVIGGLVAAVFGIWDWFTIRAKTRAKTIGLYHGAINVVVVLLFIASWVIRYGAPLHHLASSAAITLSFIAVMFALVSGWLGGELVERMGIGVAPDAGPNARSSLGTREVKARLAHRPAGAVGRR